ncbi:ABC-type transporter Mla subunit MlaD [Rhizobium anhuiense]
MAMMMNRAAEQLANVDGRLGDTTARFADSATKAAEMVSASTRLLEGKVDRLSDISGQTLSQVGGIIGRFDEHSKVLTQASQLLGAAQSNLASTLEERESALQTLSVGLVQRSAEIEKTMQGLGSMIETVFERAEQRSNQVTGNLRQGVQSSFADIGRILSETEKRAQEAAETMREAITRAGDEANTTIDGTFANVERRSGDLSNRIRGGLTASLSEVERMLGEAGRASDGAAQNMREALREAIDDAVGRFSGATEDIRRSAADIRNELDATRAELKRGAFDLPEEAKESASAMRRAVAEQIKALQDISQLVGRSSQQLEISQPVARTLAQAQPAPRPAQPVAAQPPQPVAPPSIEATGLRGTIAPSAPAAAPQRAAPQPAPDRQESGRQEPARPESGGWISDLLRGASREEAADEASARAPARPAETAAPAARSNDSRNPRHVVESLNSLSVDIARAIDHDASVDLWRRYQRGERDVFTRRLYTLKGQQTFDEIKRKYDREPEFRTAVDRYIGDFEKLLADVARTDPNRTVTQSYLTSDTGKVYTMLAHAAGRLT